MIYMSCLAQILALSSFHLPITHWYYGHFHQSWSATINGILFSMLDIMEFKEMVFTVSIRRNAYCSGERSSLLLQKIEIL